MSKVYMRGTDDHARYWHFTPAFLAVVEVARQLGKLATIAPSLQCVVHVGGAYESQECVASVVLENGVVETKPPLVTVIGEISEAQMMENFMHQMMNQRRL